MPEVELLTRGALIPETVDEEARTIDVIFATSAGVVRQGRTGGYVERLSVDNDAMDLRRLNAGAPLLNAHEGAFDARSVLGAVVPGSARVEQGKGIATIRFDSADNDPDAEKVFRKIKSGILSGVSVGYKVGELTETQDTERGLPVYLVSRWEPHEISVAPIPADFDSKFRGLDLTTKKEALRPLDKNIMPNPQEEIKAPVEETRAEAPAPVAEKIDAEQIRTEERARATEIRRAVRTAGLDDQIAETLVDSGTALDAARAEIFEKMEARSKAEFAGAKITGGEDLTEESFSRGVEAAILHKAHGSKFELTDEGREYRGLSLVDVARECLSRSGVSVKGLARADVVQRALEKRGMHTTSDFSQILANIANKSLLRGYADRTPTFEPLVNRVQVPDFRTNTRVKFGEGSRLEKVNEAGEYKYGTFGEDSENYKIETFGKIVSVTRQALVNDDVGALTRVPLRLSANARKLESKLFWDHFLSNPVMSDGVAAFATAHKNLGTGAIDIEGLSKARAAMMKQTGIDGLEIEVAPVYLICSVEKLTEAQQYLSNNMRAGSSNEINPFANTFQIISDPRIDQVDVDAWYMAASPTEIDTVEFATLEGESGPRLDTESGFDVDGMKIKISHDVGVKLLEYRGLYKSSGS